VCGGGGGLEKVPKKKISIFYTLLSMKYFISGKIIEYLFEP
jgi:hypothetical protein